MNPHSPVSAGFLAKVLQFRNFASYFPLPRGFTGSGLQKLFFELKSFLGFSTTGNSLGMVSGQSDDFYILPIPESHALNFSKIWFFEISTFLGFSTMGKTIAKVSEESEHGKSMIRTHSNLLVARISNGYPKSLRITYLKCSIVILAIQVERTIFQLKIVNGQAKGCKWLTWDKMK